MKKTNTNAIVFTQVKGDKKSVTANKYVVHALYTQNKALVEQLGGTLVKGVGSFRAEFPTAKNAKAFITQAITHIDAKDYAKTRKAEPKVKAEKKATIPTPTKAKGKKADDLVTLTDDKGNTFKVLMSALKDVCAPKKGKGTNKPTVTPTPAPNAKPKATPKKAKGNADLTDAQKKRLDICKMSILNRAASAYSIANGGSATNFKALGKAEADLKDYIPNAKAGLLKSSKWAKAVEMGITEDMLGC